MEHDIRFYVLASVLAVLSVSCILTLNIALIAASLAVAIFLAALYKLDYIVDSVIFKRTNLVQVVGHYELSGERSAAVMRFNGKYSATAAAALEPALNSRIERVKIESRIGNSRCQFRFILQIEPVDVNKLLDRIDTRMGMAEIELGRLISSNEKGNIAKIERLKRQIEHIKGERGRIGSGGTPLKLSEYIMTSATSDNRFVAQERAKSQIRELASEFGALLGSKADILAGNDLLELLKLDSGVLK